MNTTVLINQVVQQTMVFVAQLATSGGVRAPLAHVADQVFRELTGELQAQGVKKKLIADMFGMGLRTYHRRTQGVQQSKTETGHTVWEAALEYVRENQPVSTAEVKRRFRHDDPEIVSGVLNDFVQTGLMYRAGRGEAAVYRVADAADFKDEQARLDADKFVVWLAVYRHGPITAEQLSERCQLSPESCTAAIVPLLADDHVQRQSGEPETFSSQHFEVPWGSTIGWEAAVLDHFQALVRAISIKLTLGPQSSLHDTVGGSTWSLDVWQGHPLQAEAKQTLNRLRKQVESLRERIDAHNAQAPDRPAPERVVVYLGQFVESDDAGELPSVNT